MDDPCNYHTFQRLMADKEKWAQVQAPTSEGFAKYQGIMIGLICFAEGLHSFRQLIDKMADKYLEPLKLKEALMKSTCADLRQKFSLTRKKTSGILTDFKVF